LKALVELFWFKYSQLQHAVRSGDERLVAILDREIEPTLTAVFHQEARDMAELRSQFQMMVDLLREEADDKSCVLRQSRYLKMLMDRYFGPNTAAQTDLHAGVQRIAVSRVADDGLLNEAILDSLPDRVAVITTDYRYLYSNPLNASRLREKPIDLVGRHIAEFVGVQRFETRVKRHLDRCFAGEVVEYNYISPRQADAVTRCRMTPCRSSAGETLGAILVLQEALDYRGPIAA
jgi:PAS domain-containing protein